MAARAWCWSTAFYGLSQAFPHAATFATTRRVVFAREWTVAVYASEFCPCSPRPPRPRAAVRSGVSCAWRCRTGVVERRWQAGSATLLLVLLTLGQVALAVWISYWNRALFDALEARSMRAVLVQGGLFVLIFVLTIAVTALHLHVKRWLQLDWRRWLSRRLLDTWLHRASFVSARFCRGRPR